MQCSEGSRKNPELFIFFGITGNRDYERLGDLEVLRSIVQERVTWFVEQYEEHNPTCSIRLIVLTPLADGADRFFLKTVREQYPDALFMVPLPFEKNLYEKSFSSESSVSEFRNLLVDEACIETFVVEHSHPGSYSNVGVFIAENSDVLFCISDSSLKEQVSFNGGTDSIYTYARMAIDSEDDFLKAIDGRPKLGRQDGNSIPSLEKTVCTINAKEGSCSTHILNSDEEPTAPGQEELYRRFFHNPFAAAMLNEIPPEAEGFCWFDEALLSRFDKKATTAQRRYEKQKQHIIWVAFFVAVFSLLDWASGGNDFFKHNGISIQLMNWDILVTSSFIILSILIMRSRKSSSLTRWLDYRYISEHLRGLRMFVSAGVPFSQVVAPRLNDPSSFDLQRIYHSLFLYFRLYHGKFSHCFNQNDPDQNYRFPAQQIIIEQYNWHVQKSKEHKKKEHKYYLLRCCLLGISVTASITAVFLACSGWESPSNSKVADLTASGFSLLLAVTSSLAAMREHGRLGNRYRLTAMQFRNIFKRLVFLEGLTPEQFAVEVEASAIEVQEILMETTYNWISTLQDKNPDWV